jgi:hypothetical protein
LKLSKFSTQYKAGNLAFEIELALVLVLSFAFKPASVSTPLQCLDFARQGGDLNEYACLPSPRAESRGSQACICLRQAGLLLSLSFAFVPPAGFLHFQPLTYNRGGVRAPAGSGI